VNTIPEPSPGKGRRRRRKHSDEFKAEVVAACNQLGVSIAAVAMSHGVNANLARRWMLDAERHAGVLIPAKRQTAATSIAPAPKVVPSFVPLQITSDAVAPDIRIELRRGATTVSVTWPISAAAECAAWMRELLR